MKEKILDNFWLYIAAINIVFSAVEIMFGASANLTLIIAFICLATHNVLYEIKNIRFKC